MIFTIKHMNRKSTSVTLFFVSHTKLTKSTEIYGISSFFFFFCIFKFCFVKVGGGFRIQDLPGFSRFQFLRWKTAMGHPRTKSILCNSNRQRMLRASAISLWPSTKTPTRTRTLSNSLIHTRTAAFHPVSTTALSSLCILFMILGGATNSRVE